MNLRRPDSWNFSYLAVFDKTQWSLLSKIVRLIFTKMLDLLCASGINCKSNKVIVRFRLLNFWEIEIKCISTVCPPVAELAPRRFGPLFFGRQSGPDWSDF